ncbi:MAG: triose-phosphate isomerase [Candidatus Peribacteraceae bacterium]|nr:triose-phosphate isomerase [Candidatus Peribacteraceae bacterium]MDD5742027.1 triose-phosphate isomerase [Candidatus Peribacteraceae bacterium]
MTRTPLIAANWKMNPAPPEAFNPDSAYRPQSGIETIVFPTFLDVRACLEAGLPTGAQYGHPDSTGAHTGDVSMTMIKKTGCQFVLCGHSERRRDHGEKDSDVVAQAESALRNGLHPVICVGETAAERKTKRHKQVVERQVRVLPLREMVTIAYEPVWAIGTGVTPTPEQAQDMHAFIRSLIPEARRETTRILYGGSLTAENAAEFFEQPDIDGGLVGGASLKPDVFRAIVLAAVQTKS